MEAVDGLLPMDDAGADCSAAVFVPDDVGCGLIILSLLSSAEGASDASRLRFLAAAGLPCPDLVRCLLLTGLLVGVVCWRWRAAWGLGELVLALLLVDPSVMLHAERWSVACQQSANSCSALAELPICCSWLPLHDVHS